MGERWDDAELLASPARQELSPAPKRRRPADHGQLSAGETGGENAAEEALRRCILSFHRRQEDVLSNLVFHLDDGQAVLANCAIVEARMPALLSAAEPLGETDPALLDDEHSRGSGSRSAVQQVRLRSISRITLDALLCWAYGEEVPRVGEVAIESSSTLLPLSEAFQLFEVCGTLDLERLGVLLREAMLEALDVEHFAEVLRESHLRHIPCLKQGCMRFALHHFDELVEQPHMFVSTLQEFPDVVSDLFRLGRQWKDENFDRSHDRRESPRPAPAPPSSFVADLERLFDAARLAEERGKSTDADREEDEELCQRQACGRQDLAPDCRIAVGEDIYLGHSAVLAARSDFFLAAFTSDMVERASLLVTLQHVRGEMPRRESVLALLHFLYTGKTSRVQVSNAMEVLALVGGEQSEGNSDQGGYLQLHDASTLRLACEAAAESAVADDDDALLPLLIQADELGASRLKSRAMRAAVHRFKDLALRGTFVSLPPSLLTEVLRHVAVEYDRLLPSAAKGVPWELSMLPAPDGRLENTYEAVSSPDLSCGAGAFGAAGCSEASLVATFDRPVCVRRVRIGVDLTIGDFDAARLNGSKLQYLTESGSWQDAGVSVSVDVHNGVVREIDLSQALVAKAFRLVRRQRLAVGLLVFE